MEHRSLGRSGLRVSEIGLGTNNFGAKLDEEGARRVFHGALDAGVNFIDTADIYSKGRSEELIGAVLGKRRHDVILATKFRHSMGDLPLQQGASRRWIVEAVEGSLRRLRTDWIDLYQVHAPDPRTPIEETVRALDDLVRQGKIRYHGHSNFNGWQIADAEWTARSLGISRPVSAQNHYNLLERKVEAEVLPACRHFELGFIPYVPLGWGFLTGKYRPGSTPSGARLETSPHASRVLTEANFERLGKLDAFAAENGHSLLELALGWLLTNPAVSTVIASASSPEQVRENVEKSGWRLSPEQMEAVAAL